MEIIAGIYRGRKLISPRPGVRPIPVLLRKSMFDILGARILDCRFLDAFAGSGVVGLEALSRGAAWVDFVEADRDTGDVIRKNLRGLKAQAKARIHEVNYFQFLRDTSSAYDVVFMDPPYEFEPVAEAVEKTLAGVCVVAGTSLVVKAPADWSWPKSQSTLERVKAQGSNALYFFGR
ncbi:MAG: 16S rRNA (guanine(966)-N(2))-methyltransferase RsmD [Acidobacteriota bacterium]